MRNGPSRGKASPPSAVVARSAAVVAVLALATLATAAAAANPTAAATPPLDMAPAPGAVMAVPPPAPPPVLAPSEAAERFARSLVLESVGEGAGAGDGGAPGAAAAEDAAAAAASGGGDGELLRWAISHSDPAALREAAKKASELSVEERRRRVAELREVMETAVVSDTELIKRAVAELAWAAGADGGQQGAAAAQAAAAAAQQAPQGQKQQQQQQQQQPGQGPDADDVRQRSLRALETLADLAQSIDNANDLRPLGALPPLAALLAPGADPALRAAAARCVGVAASNNARFQADLLGAHPQVVARLLDALADADYADSLEAGADAPEAAAAARSAGGDKLRLPALFAASTFARSPSAASRDAFFAAGGVPRLLALLGARKGGGGERGQGGGGEDGGGGGWQLALNAAVLLGDLADLGAAGDDAGALVAAVERAGAEGHGGGDPWRALAEGVLRTLGGVGEGPSPAPPAPAAMDKALSAVRALAGLEQGKAALAQAGGQQALAAAADAVSGGGAGAGAGGGAAFREYLAELARELSALLGEFGAGASGQQRAEL